MIKRVLYTGVFVVAVLFVMQSKGMWERLRQWLAGQDQQEQSSPKLSEADWEIVPAEATPEALVYEAQEYLKEVQKKIGRMRSLKTASGLSDQQKQELQNEQENVKNLKEKIKAADEETNLLFARMDPGYVTDVKKTMQNNFEKIDVKPEDVYAYLYGSDDAAQAATYSYKDITNQIKSKLSAQDISEKDKKILRQIDYLFRTAAGKEQFDAYIKNELDRLAITDQGAIDKVNNLYQAIQDIKMELADVEDSIKRLLR